ncbi:MAG: hypothetical protein ABIT38_10910 [Gemmatimonadaceae bacterium]
MRWTLRGVCAASILAGALGGGFAEPRWRRVGGAALLLAAVVAYGVNYRMSADHMFRQPTTVRMEPAASNKGALDRLVVGVELNGEARAYPRVRARYERGTSAVRVERS